ncbi:MAG: O-antigen ligase family protein [Prevotellaceae bacterium]|nr:O-antigen ligase family protein [Prevotellaceae bacterium]
MGFIFYFVSIFLLFIVLSLYINDIKKIDKLIFGFALCESVICILQIFNVLHLSKTFEITGSSHNPNVTAMFLTLSLISILRLFQNQKTLHKILIIIAIILILFVIFKLASRTAFVGLIIIAVMLFLKKSSKYKTLIISILTVIFLVWAIPKMYEMKQNSADGRLFVWKVSVNLIENQQINGCGYGMLQGAYNQFQGEFIETQPTTATEKYNAEFIFNLMNDYLELSVSGGIVGGILYLLFLVSIIFYGIKKRDNQYFALIAVLVFAVMSCFNICFVSPQIMLLFVYNAAIINRQCHCGLDPQSFENCLRAIAGQARNDTKRMPAMTGIFSFLGVFFLILVSFMVYNQLTFKQIENNLKVKNINIAKEQVKKSFEFVDNELFNRFSGDIFFAEKDFEKSKQYYQKSLLYVFHPAVLIKMARCETALQNYKNAESYLKKAANVQPMLFTPDFDLMMLYYKTGNIDKAKKAANRILTKPRKYTSEKIDYYKDIALKISEFGHNRAESPIINSAGLCPARIGNQRRKP